MSSIPELLQSAVQLHRTGQLDQACRLYQQILQNDPANAHALNLLGLAACQTGQYPVAVELLRRAIASDSSEAAYYANLGEAYRGLGQLAEGIECYRQAIRLQPDAFAAHNNLGTLLQHSGRFDEAIASYQRALEIQPRYIEARFNIGTALQRKEDLRAAALCYQQVLDVDPDHLRALVSLGDVSTLIGDFARAQTCYERAIQLQGDVAATHFNLGNVQQRQQHFIEAIVCYRRALEIQPDHVDALCNLGNALREVGQLDEAVACLQGAIELRPSFAAALTNLGVVLQQLARVTESQSCYQQALDLEPRNAIFHCNLGTILRDQGNLLAAIECFEQSLRLDPHNKQALCSRGTALLALGRFSEGWAGYEHRVDCPQFDTRKFPQPQWDGSPLAGRTLLVHCEQGLGDTLQFVRYVKLAATRGDKIIVAAPPVLMPLLAQSGFSGLVSKDQPLPTFDVHVPLISLPGVFGTDLMNVPSEVPYLTADRGRIEAWGRELSDLSGLKVGIAWQGQPGFFGDRLRSIPLACFAPLAQVPGVRLVSLQKGPGTEQIAQVADRFEVVDPGSRLDSAGGAFLDTAAVMQHLDLVITSDTAVAHLAGALGVPVWVALSFSPDWRWLLAREDSPWYPTMRLFRQRRFGDWPEVFERLATALAQQVEESRRQPPASSQ